MSMSCAFGAVRSLLLRSFFAFATLACLASGSHAQRQMENLGRGVVAVRASADEVFVSWRLFGYEPQEQPFNLYRSANGGPVQKLNPTPLAAGTNFMDTSADPAVPNAYHVRPVVNGVELAPSASYTLPANAPVRPYSALALEPTPWATYVHLVWVGDLDGDGEYDYVVSRLPLEPGRPQFIDAYTRDGTFLWRVDFGPNSVDPSNIEPNAAAINAGHNDGVTVYDLDSDGRAEVVIKSADGVVFGDGQTLTHGDNVTQFISVLDGLTGAERARATVPDDYIADGPVAGHFGIAYLDGVKPSFVFKAKNRIGGGAFNLMVTTWDFDGTNLVQRWKFAPGPDLGDYPNFHQIRVVDVDRDGRDEICDGAYVLDDDGSVLYSLASAGVVHGDRFHIGDLDPDRPGLEGFAIQQNNADGLHYYVYDAADGTMLHRHFGDVEDNARGTAADISAEHRGYEYWSFHGIHEIKGGTLISPEPKRPWPNFRIWWDGDVMSENLNREIVEKWDPATGGTNRLLTASEDGAVDSWRDAAQFYGDIIGDWREEVVYEKTDHSALLIYTTPIPTDTRLYTLPHNPEYRLGFTVKGYQQSHMLDYYLGDGMTSPPAPAIVPVLGSGANVPVIVSFSTDGGAAADDRITNDNTPTLTGIAPPHAQIVVSLIGAGDAGSAAADASGTWSLTSAALPDGEHYFVARLADETVESIPFAIRIDTVPPSAPVIDAVISDGDGGLVIQGAADPGLRVQASLTGMGPIGATAADSSGRWSITYSGDPLDVTSYTVSAAAIDVAGNASVAGQRVVDLGVAIPTIAGVVEDTGVSGDDGVTSDRNVVISGTTDANAEVSVFQLGGGLIGTAVADGTGLWSFAFDTTFEDGTYSFTAYTGSGAGAPAFQVTIDGSAPEVEAIDQVSPTASSSSATSVTFQIRFSEGVVGLDAPDFTPVFTGSLAGAITVVEGAGEAAYNVTVSSLTGEGSVRLDLNASATGITDSAGNALAGGFSEGAVFTRVLLGNGVWTRTSSGGFWSANANWLGGIVAGGAGSTADFSTIEIPDDMLVHLDSARTVSHLIFGDEDVTSAASWTIQNDGNPASTLTFVATAADPSITVNALGAGATATIAAPLSGSNGVIKRGPGTLVLAGENTMAGTVGVSEGVLRVDAGAHLTPSNIDIANSSSVFAVAGGTVESDGTAEVNGGGDLIVTSGLARLARIAASNNTGNLVRLEGGTLIADSVSFRRSTDGSLNYGTGLVVLGGEAQVGLVELGTANSNAMMSIEGGSLTASGAIILGNQSSGGRGGHLRVIDGVFISTDAAENGGLILTRRNNNASTANFLGGASSVERITLGYDSTIAAGSATVNVDGGALYLGSGGIVKNGAAGFAARLNFISGLVGAKADWSTALDINLPENGAIVIHTADTAEAPHNIVFGGVLSGAGGFTTSGGGVLALEAANTFSGPVQIDGGNLRIAGSLSDGATLQVNTHGTLSGDGEVGRAVALNADGTIAPAGESEPIANLTLDSLVWNGGGALLIDLGADGASDRLTILGDLAKGSDGSFNVALNATEPLAPGNQFTIATFGSTTFAPNDITASGLPDGLGARVLRAGSELRVLIVARPEITGAASAAGIFNEPFSHSITATHTPTEFAAEGLPPGLALDAETGVISGVPSAAGTFAVAVRAGNEAGADEQTLTLTIAKAIAPIVLGTSGDPESPAPIRRFYTGSPVDGIATTVPAGLNLSFTYDGSPDAPTMPGTYGVVATVDDPNYEGIAEGTMVVATTALVRHAPIVNGDLDGSVQVLLAENVTLNGGALIASDLLVPGTPTVRRNGNPMFVGVQDATGAADPASHVITLNGNAVLRYLVRRVDPIDMPVADAPQPTAGTREVVLNRPQQSPGNFATLRNLTLNGGAGIVSVPPGAYGNFMANGSSGFRLGTAGATEPEVYDLQRITLNGRATLQLAGPVVLRVGGSVVINGTVGSADAPHWLTLHLASGDLTLNGSASLRGEVIAPNGSVIINGNATLDGSLAADQLTINGNGTLREMTVE